MNSFDQIKENNNIKINKKRINYNRIIKITLFSVSFSICLILFILLLKFLYLNKHKNGNLTNDF